MTDSFFPWERQSGNLFLFKSAGDNTSLVIQQDDEDAPVWQ
jgi:hypothetical protein